MHVMPTAKDITCRVLLTPSGICIECGKGRQWVILVLVAIFLLEGLELQDLEVNRICMAALLRFKVDGLIIIKVNMNVENFGKNEHQSYILGRTYYLDVIFISFYILIA